MEGLSHIEGSLTTEADRYGIQGEDEARISSIHYKGIWESRHEDKHIQNNIMKLALSIPDFLLHNISFAFKICLVHTISTMADTQ